MRTLIVGDIHGQLAALRAVLDAARPVPRDRLIFLGDYVNGGPDSCGVVEWLIELRDRWGAVCLRGNHDEMFAEALVSSRGAAAFLAMGGMSTLRSYEGMSFDAVPASHRAFFEGLALTWWDDRVICVHGRIAPEDSPERPDRAAALWGRVGDAQPHASGRTVICGHSKRSSGDPLDLGHTVCIDTGVKDGGWLTLLELPGWEYAQSDERGRVRRGRLRDSGTA